MTAVEVSGRPAPTTSAQRDRRTTALDVVLVFAVWLIGASIFFRAQLSSGFNQIMGDVGDARLIVYLNEHWYQVLHGQGSWKSPAFFYPVKDVLGWSEGFLGFQIFYAPLRTIGLDPFLSLQVTVILLSLVGYASFVFLVRAAFGTGRAASLILGLVFVFGNAMWLHAGFEQLFGVYFVPAILLIGLHAWRCGPEHPVRSALLGGIFGLFWALMFITSYYVIWFSSVAAILVGCVVGLLILIGRGWRSRVRDAAAMVGARWRSLVAAVIGLVVGIVPFLDVYIPVSRTSQGHYGYAAVLDYAIDWRGILNPSVRNLFWGSVARDVHPLTGGELDYALTPLLLAATIIAGAIALWRLWRGTATRPASCRVAVALAAVTVFFTVLPVKARVSGSQPWSLWIVVWHIPGATAIRGIDRIEIVSGLLAALCLAAVAGELSSPALRHARPRFGVWAMAGLVLLAVLAVEQFNTGVVSRLNRPAQLALLRSVPSPPASCRTFFVVDSVQKSYPFYQYQIDAMLISQKLLLPTINGYSGHFAGLVDLESPASPDYLRAALDWAQAHQLESGLCQLDLGTMVWTVHPGHD